MRHGASIVRPESKSDREKREREEREEGGKETSHLQPPSATDHPLPRCDLNRTSQKRGSDPLAPPSVHVGLDDVQPGAFIENGTDPAIPYKDRVGGRAAADNRCEAGSAESCLRPRRAGTGMKALPYSRQKRRAGMSMAWDARRARRWAGTGSLTEYPR